MEFYSLRIGLALLNRDEITALPFILPQIDTSLFEEIFCIDGNSIDGSPELIRESGIRVLTQTAKGRGNAFSMGFEEAKKLKLDALVFLSTDGNEDPKDLKRHVQALENGADISIASRMMKGSINEEDGNFFKPRKWANKFFMWIIYFSFAKGQVRITDPINGYRGVLTKSWNVMQLSAREFDIEYQMSARAYKLRLRVLEFPTVEAPRIGGQSGARAVRTTLRLAAVFLKELLNH